MGNAILKYKEVSCDFHTKCAIDQTILLHMSDAILNETAKLQEKLPVGNLLPAGANTLKRSDSSCAMGLSQVC